MTHPLSAGRPDEDRTGHLSLILQYVSYYGGENPIKQFWKLHRKSASLEIDSGRHGDYDEDSKKFEANISK